MPPKDCSVVARRPLSVSMPTVVGTHARVVSCACNAYCKRFYARGQRRLHPRLLEGSHDQTQSLRSVRHRSRGWASPLCTTTGWRTNTPCAYVLRQDISRARRFVQRPALLAVGWQSFKQGGSWPGRHRVCGGALLCEYCNIARGPIFVALANMFAIKQRSGGRQPFLLIISWNS